ncbi:hypothetical protein [Pseudonocardia parietis]|uniref:Uncharacterized protein n=1 Tax=Pseudonocardia parietis TaxID=570936 RepID=A0ABS4W1Z7_9PSEU|nr:hypothetical protein [Pseudonocardia parietis]MBP2370228.1 hypothetical protein [Pseudonocardia parietis]
MRVRMKVSVSGTRGGQLWPGIGEEIDLPDGEGADLCAAGLAEPVAVTKPAETAVDKAPAEERADDDSEKQASDKGLSTESGPARRRRQ